MYSFKTPKSPKSPRSQIINRAITKFDFSKELRAEALKLKQRYPKLKKIHRFGKPAYKNNEELPGNIYIQRSIIFDERFKQAYVLHKLEYRYPYKYCIGIGKFCSYRQTENLADGSIQTGVKIISLPHADDPHYKVIKEHAYNEAKILATMHKLHGFTNREHKIYIFMPKYKGLSLYFLFHEEFNHFSNYDLNAIALELLYKVTCLHNKWHIIHNNIKLENILWDQNSYTLNLINYNSAILVTNSKEKNFCFHHTRAYLAPETAKTHEVSYKSDMFACGRIIAEIYFPEYSNKEEVMIKDNSKYGTYGLDYNKLYSYIKQEYNSNEENKLILALLKNLLDFNPAKRMSAEKALWFFTNFICNNYDHQSYNNLKMQAFINHLKNIPNNTHYISKVKSYNALTELQNISNFYPIIYHNDQNTLLTHAKKHLKVKF